MKVLVADDQPLDRSILQITLDKWGYEVIECSDGEVALNLLLEEGSPQLAILDWMMPGLTGPEVITKLRERDTQRYTYALLLTTKDLKTDLIEGLEAGADDYIVKPVDMHELQMRLRAGRRVIELQSQLIKTQEELRIQATHDSLTGLWNRASIMDILSRESAMSQRENLPLGIIMVDLDYFKKINDSYGHITGDTVLREAAKRILSGIRLYDSVGRYGGEEFLIIAHNSDLLKTKEIAERVRGMMADTTMKVSGYDGNITISLGGTSIVVTKDTKSDDVINAADSAMYKAKESGGNSVEMAPE